MSRLNIFLLFIIILITTSVVSPKQLTKQSTKNFICTAINEKKLIKFYYADKYSDFKDWRLVEPHLIGDNKTTNNTILVAWFIPTLEQSVSGHPSEWGNYLIDRIQKLQMIDKTFDVTRPHYNPKDKRMKIIYCHL